MYQIIVPSRSVGFKLRKLNYVSTLSKGTKITVLSKTKNGKIKGEIKTREQMIKEIKKELKIK